ncbi:MAG: hypothetical protein IJS20_03190 [Bacteroidales bacterium]|nr:hypothetical protein [Bacteroidales bacterium]
MRFLKIYGGAILILLTVVLLYIFFTDPSMDKELYNTLLIVCAVLVVIGVVLMILGGKWADKIGGK